MTSQYGAPEEDSIAGYMAKFIGKKHIQGDDICETNNFTYYRNLLSSYRLFWDKPEEPSQRFVISGIHDLEDEQDQDEPPPVNDSISEERVVVSIYPLRSEVEVKCDSRDIQGSMKVRFATAGSLNANFGDKQEIADDLYEFVVSIVDGRGDDALEQWEDWRHNVIYNVTDEKSPAGQR